MAMDAARLRAARSADCPGEAGVATVATKLEREQELKHVRYLMDASAHVCTDRVRFAAGIVLRSSNVRRGLNEG